VEKTVTKTAVYGKMPMAQSLYLSFAPLMFIKRSGSRQRKTVSQANFRYAFRARIF
jgi:hypothetical protein